MFLFFAIVFRLSNLWSLCFCISQYQYSPLIMAADRGHARVVQLLLSAGANIEAVTEVILMIHNYMAV